IHSPFWQPHFLFQLGKKIAPPPPYLCPARKPVPVDANQADEFVTFINWNDVMLRADAARRADAVHQKSLHRRFDLLEDRVCLNNVVPGIEREQRLGGTGRARIKSADFSLRSAVEEKRHLDRDHQTVPLAVRHLEFTEEQDTPWHALVFRRALTAE